MDINLFWDRLEKINTWKSGEDRAPHKPLLLLYILAKYSRGGSRLTLFSELEPDLKNLLFNFGPPRSKFKPHDPFWRLQKDGIWEVTNQELIQLDSSGNVKISELRNYGTEGGFPADLFNVVKQSPNLILEIAQRILDQHFPESLHYEIMDAAGFRFEKICVTTSRIRDPKFRNAVLDVYGRCCSVCGFDLKIGNSNIALEAAHIQWHSHEGPDDPSNGLSLCTMHHELLDRGAWSISNEGKIIISKKVKGSTGLNEWLSKFSEKQLLQPLNIAYEPKSKYITWHKNQVFKG